MSPLDPRVQRYRDVRRDVLRHLVNIGSVSPHIALRERDIVDGVLQSTYCDWDEAELRSALEGLLAEHLIERTEVDDGRHMRAAYKATRRGHDFWLANCPWERIDAFTGDQHA